MGLDIHKYEVNKGTDELTLLKNDVFCTDDITAQNFFKMIPHRTRMESVYDIKGFFENRNEDYNDYFLIEEYYYDDENSYFKFEHKETSNKVKVFLTDMPEKYDEMLYVNVAYNFDSSHYQRRGLKPTFKSAYQDTYPQLTGDSIIFINDNNGLDIIKEHAEDDTYIKDWILKKNEFVVIDW